MLRLGYKLMSEEHGPKQLVKNAALAEKAGFDFAAIDHFFPWIEEQGPLASCLVRAGGDCPCHGSDRTDDSGHLPDHALPQRSSRKARLLLSS
jgi:hypothetical protein